MRDRLARFSEEHEVAGHERAKIRRPVALAFTVAAFTYVR
jgi:hypothetical protein